MQALLNFAFDLDTSAGRAEFQRMFQHLVTETDERQGMPSAPDLPAETDQAETAPTGRQAAAAKARAAKAAKAAEAAEAAAPAENGEDLERAAPNGADAEAEDIGLVDPGMSPAEAKDAALAIVREVYEAGQTAQVRALQKAWGGGKFYDLPNEKGHEFYRQVMKMAHETGLRK